MRSLATIASFLLATALSVAQVRSPAPPAGGERDIDGVHGALRDGTLTCHDLVSYYLRRIAAYDKSGPALNAVVTVNPGALAEADRLDTLPESEKRRPLYCVPILVKDQLDTGDIATTYGSAAFRHFRPQNDATVVSKLKAAGAIILAKAAMGEFASGYAGSISGPVRNPYDPHRHASGSSSGTGAGVAANFATVGIGEDTGGSVRGPAAAASLVGLRPTVPLVSRHGMFPARPSIDTIGPIARTVRDAALVLDVIAGYDAHDPVTAYAYGHIAASYTSALRLDRLKGARIGVVRTPMDLRTDVASQEYREIHAVFDRSLEELRAAGARLLDPVTITDAARRLDQTYDANVYETETAIDAFLATHTNSPRRTLRDILLSREILPSRASTLIAVVGKTQRDPGYADVQERIEALRRDVLGIMASGQLDALVYPTADLKPGLVAADVMTSPAVDDTRRGSNRRLASVVGFPAITVPGGFADGMPVGVEFLGRPFSEDVLLGLAYAFEQRTHHRRPPPTTPEVE